jgi:NAD(P)-dependent dehydrogenase (short-subunit alcohol dehydrogenase family)
MNTPVYIVTGATGGIGREIVAGLVRDHAPCHIILAVRSVDRGNELADRYSGIDGVTVEARHLDLSTLASVHLFADGIKASGLRINGLINNAGIMPGGVTLTTDNLEIATQTNFVATAVLTLCLHPLIVDGGAIVFTTSITRLLPRLHRNWATLAVDRHQRFVTYGRSKLMLTHFALEMAQQLEPRHIRVNCSDPGVADTAILRLGHPIVDRLADMLVRPIVHTAAQGATAALRALTADTTACIFTLKGCKPIPPKWLQHKLHKPLIEDIAEYFRTLKKLSKFAPQSEP